MSSTKGIFKALENLISDSQTSKPLKILIVAVESAPYASVGGFSSVIAYLSKELKRLGHDVRIFMPKFGFIDERKYGLKLVKEGLKVPTDFPENPYLMCNVKTSFSNNVQTYFLENQEYYELRANVYGYSDDPTRWALLSRGVLEFIKSGEFVPDVIHCNDWHTGIVSNYLKTMYEEDKILSKIPTIFTIHNLAIQGNFDHWHVTELDMDDGRSAVASFFDERLNKQNFMRRGILYSDAVNTVSKTYSKEILSPEFGQGLDKLLLELRSKLYGIVNGLDYEEFNPETDKLIEKNYDINSLELRLENKISLQKEFGLKESLETPLFGFVGRLDWQKGVDMMVKVLENVMKNFDAQFVEVGGGDGVIADMLRNLQRQFPDKVGVHTHLNFALSRSLFSGCDIILYPSRFEPCGIVQLEAMRYGALPLVRKVGGLADTVEDVNSVDGTGTGFVFNDFDEFSLYGQIVRAIELYRNKVLWRKLQRNVMKKDFSWGYSAKEYERLYLRANSLKNTESHSMVMKA